MGNSSNSKIGDVDISSIGSSITGAISSLDANKISLIAGSSNSNDDQVVFTKISRTILVYGMYTATSNVTDGTWIFDLNYWKGKGILPEYNIYFPGYCINDSSVQQKTIRLTSTSTSAHIDAISQITSGNKIQFQFSYNLTS